MMSRPEGLGTAREPAPSAVAPVPVRLVEITIAGALVHAAVPEVSTRLDAVLALHPTNVVIDVSDCPMVDAAAIAMLLDVHRRLWSTDGLLSLRGPGARLRRLLRVARVDNVLHIIPEATTTPMPALLPGGTGPAGHGGASPQPAVASPAPYGGM